MADALTAALNAGVSLDEIERMTTMNGFSLDEIAKAAESIAARKASQHDAIGADDVRDCLDTDDRKTDKDGFPAVRCTASNFLEIMRRDSHFAGLKFNVLRELPELHTSAKKRLWTDADDAVARFTSNKITAFRMFKNSMMPLKRSFKSAVTTRSLTS